QWAFLLPDAPAAGRQSGWNTPCTVRCVARRYRCRVQSKFAGTRPPPEEPTVRTALTEATPASPAASARDWCSHWRWQDVAVEGEEVAVRRLTPEHPPEPTR